MTRGAVAGGAATGRTIRYAIAGLLLACAVALVAGEQIGRSVESSIARWLLHTVSGMEVLGMHASTVPAVVFRSGNLRWNVLEITLECAIALTLAGLLVIGAALVCTSRCSPGRVLLAMAAGTSLLVLVNQVRIVMLALVLAHGGVGPFEWAHSFAGSVVSLAGLAGTLFVVFTLVIRPGAVPGRDTRTRSRQEAHA
ncbi:exosortase/archaeosortase family protein [Curtobacterium sp. MMLR14_010]|uniref:exosortase/archaeosortase family protein n=1 Tax=Curtobacterium sp. MMLR14_010 TaxID=1898743 RepID=UPI00111411CF|nr:exosortase/archaeosortase family protein [Curtobacterium sp. MMLR14_010]